MQLESVMARETILVVEDCAINLKLCSILLRDEGYEVLATSSGPEALALLRKRRPHLILVDVQMPDMDGLTLTRLIKKEKDMRDIPVIALTALAMQGDRGKALAAGCDAYLSKPADIHQLRDEIRKLLGMRPQLNPQGDSEGSSAAHLMRYADLRD